MGNIEGKEIGYLEKLTLENLGDGPATERQARCLVWFFLYGDVEPGQYSESWTGAVFRQKGTLWLLTVKRRLAGIPEVVFLTGRNPTECVEVYIRQYHNGRLRWVPDKYP